MTAVPTSTTSTSTATIWKATLLAAVVATVVNVLIFVIGKAAGVEYTVIENGSPVAITVANVAVPSLVGMVIGALAAVVALPRWPSSRRVLEVLGVVLGAGTGIFPWFVEADTGTKVLLTLMHIVLAVAYVAGIEASVRGD